MLWIILSIVLLVGIALGSFFAFASYQMSKIPAMTFEEMLIYTTKGQSDAVITVGTIKNGEISYTAYGENGVVLPLQEEMYEIGSITKTFTASLLCKAADEGKMNLDDAIDQYLNLPEKEYYPTVERLITHTSGYKSYYFEKPMVSNFLNRRNDFYGITNEMLMRQLGKIMLEDQNYPFKYSNFGFAAMGAVLEEVYDQDYATLMNTYISEELGLANTRLSDGSDGLQNCWEWAESDAYLPAGAIISDISDMMRYVQIQMGEEFDYLSTAHEPLANVEATTGNYERMGIRIDAVGVGWMIDEENNIIWHNGGTGSYNCYLGFDKERQVAVVVLSNLPPNHRIPATVIGVKCLKDLQDEVDSVQE